MMPLLEIAGKAGGQEIKLNEAVDTLAKHFNLTEEQLAELLPSGATFKFASRVSWARTYLNKAVLIDSPKRGYFRLTARGEKVLSEFPHKIDNKFLSRFKEFKEFQGRKKAEEEEGTLTKETPIAASFQLPEPSICQRMGLCGRCFAHPLRAYQPNAGRQSGLSYQGTPPYRIQRRFQPSHCLRHPREQHSALVQSRVKCAAKKDKKSLHHF